ncbi:hypothetical protein EVAR_73889_1 [Eumeta japonica]|uniref:Uncharacterized protein n=1 Tax=Eumeta variegata TaxID=151549 RepID=A0A4C1SU12_EUMVA|nr:hypothetical protein EVAR_73889_1 [Eumeta japonica]
MLDREAVRSVIITMECKSFRFVCPSEPDEESPWAANPFGNLLVWLEEQSYSTATGLSLRRSGTLLLHRGSPRPYTPIAERQGVAPHQDQI